MCRNQCCGIRGAQNLDFSGWLNSIFHLKLKIHTADVEQSSIQPTSLSLFEAKVSPCALTCTFGATWAEQEGPENLPEKQPDNPFSCRCQCCCSVIVYLHAANSAVVLQKTWDAHGMMGMLRLVETSSLVVVCRSRTWLLTELVACCHSKTEQKSSTGILRPNHQSGMQQPAG